jgi:hypothetical protein
MKITNKKNALKLSCAVVTALAVLMIASLVVAEDYPEGKQLYFKCVNDKDNEFSQCSAVYHSIKKVENGVVTWGNLVAGYQCINNYCTQIYGGMPISYTFSLSELDKFCKLLKPNECKGEWVLKP